MLFLVDVNLPKRFKFFHTPDFSFVADIDARMKDHEIWDLAITTDRVILTKDVDFFYRSLMAEKRAKVVHFNIGSMKLSDLHIYFQKNWNQITELLEKADLIVAETDQLKKIL